MPGRGRPRRLCRRTGLRALRAAGICRPCLRDAVARRARRTASPMPATAPSTAAAWRRAISTGRATSRPTTIPTRPGSASPSALDKGDFIGRDALVEHQGGGSPARKLCSFTVDGFAPFHGGEAIYRDGTARRLDHERRLRPHAREDHRLRLCAGRARAARRTSRSRPSASAIAALRGPRCLYDPKMERLKA